VPGGALAPGPHPHAAGHQTPAPGGCRGTKDRAGAAPASGPCPRRGRGRRGGGGEEEGDGAEGTGKGRRGDVGTDGVEARGRRSRAARASWRGGRERCAFVGEREMNRGDRGTDGWVPRGAAAAAGGTSARVWGRGAPVPSGPGGPRVNGLGG
jgi:hypothetical protein